MDEYDEEDALKAKEWIETLIEEPLPLGEDGEEQSFADAVADGSALCKLINAIKPGSIKKIHQSKMPFKQRDNASAFLRAAQSLGLKNLECFPLTCLLEREDTSRVLATLTMLSRRVQRTVPEFEGPHLAAPLAEKSEIDKSRWKDSRGVVSAIGLGSSKVMEKTEVHLGLSVAFASRGSGEYSPGVRGAVPQTSIGSANTMEKPEVDLSSSVTFAHEVKGHSKELSKEFTHTVEASGATNVPVKMMQGSHGFLKREHLSIDNSKSVDFGAKVNPEYKFDTNTPVRMTSAGHMMPTKADQSRSVTFGHDNAGESKENPTEDLGLKTKGDEEKKEGGGGASEPAPAPAPASTTPASVGDPAAATDGDGDPEAVDP